MQIQQKFIFDELEWMSVLWNKTYISSTGLVGLLYMNFVIGSILAFSTGYLGCLLVLVPDYITDLLTLISLNAAWGLLAKVS